MLRIRLVVMVLTAALVAAGCSGSASDTEVAVDDTQTQSAVDAQPDDVVETESEPTATAAPAPTEVPATAEPAEPEAEPADEPAAEDSDDDTDQPSLTGFDAVTATVEDFVAERGLNGAGLIVVHRDDGVLYHEHFGEFTEDRISLIASSSKMIAAGVLLSLQEDGLLDINAPVADQVAWGDPASQVTPAQLLSNSSGLVGLGPDLLYAPYICQWTPTSELEECGETVLAGPDDDADVIAPDTEFRYGGAQWQVAGAVAETVSGKTWEQLIDEIYVEPCGVDSLGFISLGSVFTGAPGYPTMFAGNPDGVEATENPNIEGGGHISSGDYGELLLMHLRGGMCGDTQVLTPESIATMHADRIAGAYDGSAAPNTGYGMGWWIDRDSGRISDGGAFGTVPWLDLDDGYGAYLVIEDSSDTGQQLARLIEDLVHEAVVG